MFDLHLSPGNHRSVAKLTYPTRNSFHDTFRKIVRFIAIGVIVIHDIRQ